MFCCLSTASCGLTGGVLFWKIHSATLTLGLVRAQTDRQAEEEAAQRAADEALRERERQDALRKAAATYRARETLRLVRLGQVFRAQAYLLAMLAGYS